MSKKLAATYMDLDLYLESNLYLDLPRKLMEFILDSNTSPIQVWWKSVD